MMASGIFGLGQLIQEFWSVWAKLSAQVAGVGFYSGVAHLFMMSAYKEHTQIPSNLWSAIAYSY